MAVVCKGPRNVKVTEAGSQVDVAWFCWDASSARVTDSHSDLIRLVEKQDIPVIAVLTKTATHGGQVKADHLRCAQRIASERMSAAKPNVYPRASVVDEVFESPVYGLEDQVAASVAVRDRKFSDGSG